MSEHPTPTPRSRAAVRQAWVQRLGRFATAGLRPAQFCAAEGVSLPSFYSWKRRLAAEALGPGTEQAAGPDTGPRLLPVRLGLPGAAVELLLPSGAVLRVGPGCDPAFVRSLAEALGGAPC
jgi:transposase